MHLNPEDIAAAETCGIKFLPASDAQVQRLAMQRKVFYRAGEPILATRGDGLFETAGTLQRLIEEGRRQQRDLTQWLQQAVPPVADTEAPPEAEAGAGLVPEPAVVSLDVPQAEPEAEPGAAVPLPAGQPRSSVRSAPRATGAAAERGKRWLVAGAIRRGRAGKHWSTRQR